MAHVHLMRGMAAGLLAGAAASWVMNQFQQVRAMNPPQPQGGSGRSSGGSGVQSQSDQGQQGEDTGMHASSDLDENATVQTAQRISQQVLHRNLTESEKQIAGPAVHYAYGSLVGALYGGMAELLPVTAAGLGLPFGFALWVLGDEIAIPALGLGKQPMEYSPEVHADALAAHFMYGATTDVVRRFLRHVV
jgi:putative membrane protein